MRYFLPISERQQTVNRYQFNKQYILNTSNILTYWTNSYANSSSATTSSEYLAWIHTNNLIGNTYHYKQTVVDQFGNKLLLTFQGIGFPKDYFYLTDSNSINIWAETFSIVQPYNFVCADGIVQNEIYLLNNSITTTINSNSLLLNNSGDIVSLWVDKLQSLLLFEQSSADFALTLNATNHINEYEAYCIIPAQQFNSTLNITSYNIDGTRLSQTMSIYISSLGLYNKQNQLLAIAKLSHPVRKSNKIDMIFNIQFDFN